MFRLSLARRSNMYTVGRLISQGVYTVAGPFHPFGGAVDIIVVQQQDGSYKSSPWYVKFGKFQGVLKRSEKVVNIAVNDANVKFHMYLDSAGEAYFLKDAEPEKEPSPSQLAITAGDEVLAIEDAPSKLEDGLESKEEFADAKEDAEEVESSDEKDSNLELRFEGRKASYLLVQQARAAEEANLAEAKQFTEPSESSSFKEDTDITRKNELLEKSTSEGDTHVSGKDEIPESNTLTHDTDVAGAIEYLEISTFKKDTEALGDAEFSESISLKDDIVDFIVDTEILDSNTFKEESRTIGEPSDDLLSSLAALKLRSNFETSIEELENTTGGAVVNAFLKQAVGLEDSQQAGRPSTSLVAQAALASVAKAAWESGGEGSSSSLGTGARDSFEVLNNRGEVVAEGFRMRKSKSLNMGSRSSADEPVRVRRVKSESDLRLLNTDGRRRKGESGLGPHNIGDNSPELSTLTIASADGVVVLHTPRRGSPPPLPSLDDQIQKQPIMYEADGLEKPLVLGMLSFDKVVSDEAQGDNQAEKTDPSPEKKEVNALISTAGSGWKLWPFPLRRPRTPETNGSRPAISSQALLVAQNAAVNTAIVNNLIPDKDYYRSRKNKVRSFLPTSQMLAEMNLKEGSNRITFTFLTRVLGSQQVDARIYLWKWNTRVVISDVDGTITKSDVLGQVMPLVGRDWTQSGVTRLFSAIKENGYEVMFLSARAISQAYLTRQFLLNLKQDGEALPDGPVVISPDGLFPSLYREVIRRAPHEFKIACLQDIRDLFPEDCNPFYAGFGNRETDEISYLKVGIPKGKVFIINPKGEVAVNNRVDVKSYTSLHKLVDDMFPPQTNTEQEAFNSWNYWKMPLPDIEDELSIKSGSKPKKTK